MADTQTLPVVDPEAPLARFGSAIHLDHCVIHVSDWARSTTFYRDVIGAEVIPVGAGFAYRLAACS